MCIRLLLCTLWKIGANTEACPVRPSLENQWYLHSNWDHFSSEGRTRRASVSAAISQSVHSRSLMEVLLTSKNEYTKNYVCGAICVSVVAIGGSWISLR